MTVETRLRFRCSADRAAWELELWPQWALECPSEDRDLMSEKKGAQAVLNTVLQFSFSPFPSLSE